MKVCDVKTNKGDFQVVCGALNAREGMLGVFAPENSFIPGTKVKLKRSKIRGVESCGMLVSEREMGRRHCSSSVKVRVRRRPCRSSKTPLSGKASNRSTGKELIDKSQFRTK